MRHVNPTDLQPVTVERADLAAEFFRRPDKRCRQETRPPEPATTETVVAFSFFSPSNLSLHGLVQQAIYFSERSRHARATVRAAFADMEARIGILVPKIENIHQKVYAAASQPGALDMAIWHSGPHTHCRGGWVIELAGEAGYRLEQAVGASLAARVIYAKSDPDYLAHSDSFSASDEDALADMKECAEREAAKLEAKRAA